MNNKFLLKGNYFKAQFHQNNLGSKIIQKLAPSDTDVTLWSFLSSAEHVEEIVDSAVIGHSFWKKTSIEERIKILLKYKENLVKKSAEIATAIAWETGKPIWECKSEAAGLANKVDVTISDSLPRIKNMTITKLLPGTNGHFIYKPIGPSLVIAPFNFPCHLANGQIISLLLGGNSIIFKPSEKTAYSPQLMFECLVEAGFPSGVINLFQGGGIETNQLVIHPKIKGIFFTGSQNVGKIIAKNCSDQFSKLLALEMGGKNISIIHKDASLNHAVAELINSCFLSSGQRCTSTGIIAVHHLIKDQLIEEFTKATQKILVGHSIEEGDSFMGPLIDEQAENYYFDYTNKAIAEGAEIILPAKKIQKRWKGHYSTPSILFYDMTKGFKSFIGHEIFAPNVTIIPYHHIEEAIALTNSTDYGLASAIFTSTPQIYQKCLEEIDCGLINLNKSTVGASARLPFGGHKNSGNYRPAAVTMIDSCVQLSSSLENWEELNGNWKLISGLAKEI